MAATAQIARSREADMSIADQLKQAWESHDPERVAALHRRRGR